MQLSYERPPSAVSVVNSHLRSALRHADVERSTAKEFRIMKIFTIVAITALICAPLCAQQPSAPDANAQNAALEQKIRDLEDRVIALEGKLRTVESQQAAAPAPAQAPAAAAQAPQSAGAQPNPQATASAAPPAASETQ